MPGDGMARAGEVVECVARESYGRLIAFLSARTRDVAGVEDALSEAFVAALRTWPDGGIPDHPEAWLLKAARRRLLDHARHMEVRDRHEDHLRTAMEEAGRIRDEPFPDERLKLLLVCAHPAIDPAARTPLMLQTVLGVEVDRIASAFLTSPSAMNQRLVRAKARIRATGIPFRIPEPNEWPERMGFVLDAVYSAYTAGWEQAGELDSPYHGLASDAISLGRILAGAMPDEAEVHGLLALMLYCEARTAARYQDGKFVPLPWQDVRLWSEPLIEEADRHLNRASSLKKAGRYQCEAAIQSVHAARRKTGQIEWAFIVKIYGALERLAPSLGAAVGSAIAWAETGDAGRGLKILDSLPADRVKLYQPFWAARGHVLDALGDHIGAGPAWDLAMGLSDQEAVRQYLAVRKAMFPRTGRI